MPMVIGSKARSERQKTKYGMRDCNKIKIYEHADSLDARQSIFNSDGFRWFWHENISGSYLGIRSCSLVLDPMAGASD